MIPSLKQNLRNCRSLPLFLTIIAIILHPPLRAGDSLNNLIVVCVMTGLFGLSSFYLKAKKYYLIAFALLSLAAMSNILSQIVFEGGAVIGLLQKARYINLTLIELATSTVLVHHAFFSHESSIFDRLFSALSSYLMLILLWSGFYSIVLIDNPCSIIDTVKNLPVKESELVYFSMITLATQGYGDILPVSQTARTLAGLQGVVGNLFLATIIASLIGLLQSRKSS